MYICGATYIYTHFDIYTHMPTYLCIYIYIHIYMCIYINIYPYTRIHIHICIRIHMYICGVYTCTYGWYTYVCLHMTYACTYVGAYLCDSTYALCIHMWGLNTTYAYIYVGCAYIAYVYPCMHMPYICIPI